MNQLEKFEVVVKDKYDKWDLRCRWNFPTGRFLLLLLHRTLISTTEPKMAGIAFSIRSSPVTSRAMASVGGNALLSPYQRLWASCDALPLCPERSEPFFFFFFLLQRFRGKRCCCSRISNNNGDANNYGSGGDTPKLLRIAVSGVTELLRILSPISKRRCLRFLFIRFRVDIPSLYSRLFFFTLISMGLSMCSQFGWRELSADRWNLSFGVWWYHVDPQIWLWKGLFCHR